MNNKELKSLIKEMVRESLTEIFVEMKLESIVENVISKSVRSSSRLTERNQTETVEETPVYSPPKIKPRNNAVLRENLRKKLGVSEDQWETIYGDISDSNPILSSNSSLNENTNPEFVPESTLEETGLMKDYSRFLK